MTSTTAAEDGILKQDSLGRVRITEQRRQALLEEYERSGMSGAEFAGFVGVKYQTFATWIQKRRRGLKAEGAGGCSAVAKPMQWMEAVSPDKAEAERAGLVVYIGAGARMEVFDTGGAVLAAQVLRQLSAQRAC